MKDKSLVFSWWLWALAILYNLGITSYSPLLPLICAIIFAIYTVIFKFTDKYHWTKKVVIVLLETFFTVLSYLKDPSRPIFNTSDILITVLITMVYLVYVDLSGTTIRELYFKTIPESHEGETFVEHIKMLTLD